MSWIVDASGCYRWIGPETIARWAAWRVAHPHWVQPVRRAASSAIACGKAAGASLPLLALPPSAPIPPRVPPPALASAPLLPAYGDTGPAYALGSGVLFAAGGFGFPGGSGTALLPYYPPRIPITPNPPSRPMPLPPFLPTAPDTASLPPPGFLTTAPPPLVAPPLLEMLTPSPQDVPEPATAFLLLPALAALAFLRRRLLSWA